MANQKTFNNAKKNKPNQNTIQFKQTGAKPKHHTSQTDRLYPVAGCNSE
jgi:hypothetical protein